MRKHNYVIYNIVKEKNRSEKKVRHRTLNCTLNSYFTLNLLTFTNFLFPMQQMPMQTQTQTRTQTQIQTETKMQMQTETTTGILTRMTLQKLNIMHIM